LPQPTKAFNHVGVSVTDIDCATQWYQDVIQMTILVEPMEITTYDKEEKNYDPHLATLMRAIFKPQLGRVKICHMISANGVGNRAFSIHRTSR
jgi:hypothetical protein